MLLSHVHCFSRLDFEPVQVDEFCMTIICVRPCHFGEVWRNQSIFQAGFLQDLCVAFCRCHNFSRSCRLQVEQLHRMMPRHVGIRSRPLCRKSRFIHFVAQHCVNSSIDGRSRFHETDFFCNFGAVVGFANFACSLFFTFGREASAIVDEFCVFVCARLGFLVVLCYQNRFLRICGLFSVDVSTFGWNADCRCEQLHRIMLRRVGFYFCPFCRKSGLTHNAVQHCVNSCKESGFARVGNESRVDGSRALFVLTKGGLWCESTTRIVCGMTSRSWCGDKELRVDFESTKGCVLRK